MIGTQERSCVGYTASLGLSMDNPDVARERELVQGVKARRKSAFLQLVQRYQAQVFSIIARVVSRDEVEAVAQRVFVRACERMVDFDGRTPLYAWIYRLAVNEAYRHVARSPRQAAAGTARDTVNALLAQLPEDERLLLIWREVECLPVDEIAELSGWSPGYVEQKLREGRLRMMQACV